MPAGATVLDLACGGGRHVRTCLDRGLRVSAVDRDLSGIVDLNDPRIDRVPADLEDGSPWPLPGATFAAVVVTNYLHRPLFPAILDAVAPGGLLIYETFARGHEQLGRPRRDAFLLVADELLEEVRAATGFQVVAFEQGRIATPSPAVVQRLCAQRGGQGDPAFPPRALDGG